MSDRVCTLVWFRQDLRLRDNPALQAAIARGGEVVPIFLWTPGEEGDWAPGAASRWFLHEALANLQRDLSAYGGRLLCFRGEVAQALLERLIEATGATAVYWNRRYEPRAIKRDAKIKEALKADGIEARSFNASLLYEPQTVAREDGTGYAIYSPFRRAVQGRTIEAPVEVDLQAAKFLREGTQDDGLEALSLLPKVRWDQKLAQHWEVSVSGAHGLLEGFLREHVTAYHHERNRPDRPATSKLSPFLHWGLIGPREIYAATNESEANGSKGARKFLDEVRWREFAYHLLYHHPQLPDEALDERFRNFPWEPDEEKLRAWQRGETGYPIVDAGLRELWETGWMHNRTRMICGSFLTKDLLQPWTDGERWFWDCLVDADLASNGLGWQWVSGGGADGSPYPRIFNPMLQGKKFDPDGAYVRRWVPELAKLPDEVIHTPWEADAFALAEAGVTLGKDYPHPLVAHHAARKQAMAAFAQVGMAG